MHVSTVSAFEPLRTQIVKDGIPLRAGERLDDELFHTLRSRAVLEGCKWVPQVGDAATLAPFPLLLPKKEWAKLVIWSERLTTETVAAELEILHASRQSLGVLGLPRAVLRALSRDAPLTPAALRWLRFDFHFTTDGWQVSEVNSDVPGGFSESSFFTELVAEHMSDASPTGNPANIGRTRWRIR